MKNHRFIFLHVLPATALALLAACGGGSYGGSGAAAPPPVAMPTAANPPASMTGEQYSATLAGGSEVPPNPSGATGAGTLTVDTATRAMSATVTTSGIAGTDAHIHMGAVGVSGAIVFPLAQTSAGSGVWSTSVTISDAQLATLRAGDYYFNVHSMAYPAGEIRGQIRPK